MPIQSVAQNTKLCSCDIASMLPASTSPALPSRPWPYRDGRGRHHGGPADRHAGIWQMKFAAWVLPGVLAGMSDPGT